VYVPVIGPWVIFLWPAPIAIIQLRHGFKISVLTVIVAGVSLASIVGPVEALGLVSTFGLSGLTFGYCFKKRYKPVKVLLLGALALLASAGISFAISFLVMGISPMQMLNEFGSAMQSAIAIYRKMGIPEETISNLETTFKGAAEVLKIAFPAMLLLAGLVNSLINFEVLRSILIRMGYSIENLPVFAEWQFPTYLSAFFIAGLLLLGTKNILNSPLLYNLGMNLYSVASMLFMVQGISIGYHYLRKGKISKVLSMVILGFVVMSPILGQLAVWFGLLDLVFDYRKLKIRNFN
jgi:uncharacterized protein YybS (DUF2232 family)